jgi:hypothetical protein
LRSALLLCVSCRTAHPLPPADFSSPGWRLRQGQAVWKPSKSRPELAGDLLLAVNTNGNFVIQFSKTPFTLASAQVADGRWQIDFGAGQHSWSGRGAPPARFLWFQLSRVLAGAPPGRPGDSHAGRTVPGGWKIRHGRIPGGPVFPMRPRWFPGGGWRCSCRWRPGWPPPLRRRRAQPSARAHSRRARAEDVPATFCQFARTHLDSQSAADAEAAKSAAQSIAANLRQETNLVADATWQPPWLEHPEQMAELIGYLWLNQPPEVFGQLADRLAETNLNAVLAATRERLATTLSPADLAQLSYDPFGLTQLPPDITGAAPGFGQGQDMFASADGAFRIIFVKARGELNGYRECTEWFNAVKNIAESHCPRRSHVNIGYTGRPAFVAEISGSMKHDITLSVGGTALIIAILFWLAHRRWKPMLWLLTLLALILAARSRSAA